MNILARSVLEMYRFDPQADDTSRDNLMRQSIDLISKFPTIMHTLITCCAMPRMVVRCISVIRVKNCLSQKTSCIC